MKDKIQTIGKSVLILVLVVLVGTMMLQIEKLQGTARVINYAGLVRGATQREVKLEVTGNENDELIQYLDDILSGLKYQDGHYDLIRLNDDSYLQKLDVQIALWQQLKVEIKQVRKVGWEQTDIVEMSEEYFALADETVAAAEAYSEHIAALIRGLEIASAVDMAVLVLILVAQTVEALRIMKQNRELKQKAYLDLHTGLPNKSKCEELLHDPTFIEKPLACVMFDLNNLKKVNDTLGHTEGDRLILNFARILRQVVPQENFVGRYGGDEFIGIIDNATQAGLTQLMKDLQAEIDRFNADEENIKISFAYGWAFSTDYAHCTLRMLFDRADRYMYENKLRSKQSREAAEAIRQ